MLPRTTILLLLFLTAFIWIAVSLIIINFTLSTQQSVVLHSRAVLLPLEESFTCLQVILMLLLAVRLRCIIWDLSRSFLLRLAITIFSIILIYTMAQVNVVSRNL